MGRFSGRGGELYAVAEPFAFEGLPLEDCGDGWTWRLASPGLRCLAPDSSPLFEVWASDLWLPLPVDEVHHATGVVSLARCVRGQSVRASGICLPQALLGRSASWILEVAIAFADKPVLAGAAPAPRKMGAGVRLDGIKLDRVPDGPVRAVLPFGRGVWVGFGVAKVTPSIAQVTLDERGAYYGPA